MTRDREPCCVRLQRNFTETVFHKEQQRYATEGIAFDHVEFTTNDGVIRLIAPQPGATELTVLTTIQEETRVLSHTEFPDRQLLERLDKEFGGGAGSMRRLDGPDPREGRRKAAPDAAREERSRL